MQITYFKVLIFNQHNYIIMEGISILQICPCCTCTPGTLNGYLCRSDMRAQITTSSVHWPGRYHVTFSDLRLTLSASAWLRRCLASATAGSQSMGDIQLASSSLLSRPSWFLSRWLLNCSLSPLIQSGSSPELGRLLTGQRSSRENNIDYNVQDSTVTCYFCTCNKLQIISRHRSEFICQLRLKSHYSYHKCTTH